jgi:hypothetical protein
MRQDAPKPAENPAVKVTGFTASRWGRMSLGPACVHSPSGDTRILVPKQMRSRRRTPRLLVVALLHQTLTLLLLLLSSPSGVTSECDAQEPSGQTTEQCASIEEVKVQLRWLKNGQFAGFYAAQDLGYYAEVTLTLLYLFIAPAQYNTNNMHVVYYILANSFNSS